MRGQGASLLLKSEISVPFMSFPQIRIALFLLGAIIPFRLQSAEDLTRLPRPHLLAAMQEVMGPLPGKAKRCPLDVRMEEEVDCGDYVRRLVTYEAEPNSTVPAYLLIPKAVLQTTKPVATGILCLHQTHAKGQKVVVGLGSSVDDEYAVELVKRGFVCLAPPYPLLADYAPDLRGLGYKSGTMKAVWNNIRGLDLLESLPYVRKGVFGSIGHSLGGHNSLFTAAFDERIKAVVTSCGFDSFNDYMNGNIKGWTSERYMPALLDYTPATRTFDFQHVLAAIAPRAVFVSAPFGDSNFKWDSVDRVCNEARKVYAQKGRSSALIVQHPNSAHRFPPEYRQLAYEFLEKELKK